MKDTKIFLGTMHKMSQAVSNNLNQNYYVLKPIAYTKWLGWHPGHPEFGDQEKGTERDIDSLLPLTLPKSKP